MGILSVNVPSTGTSVELTLLEKAAKKISENSACLLVLYPLLRVKKDCEGPTLARLRTVCALSHNVLFYNSSCVHPSKKQSLLFEGCNFGSVTNLPNTTTGKPADGNKRP